MATTGQPNLAPFGPQNAGVEWGNVGEMRMKSCQTWEKKKKHHPFLDFLGEQIDRQSQKDPKSLRVAVIQDTQKDPKWCILRH
jgi:hypothetical protein